ncbi:MAG TPA: hypothetical protein VEA40_24385 [Ramlibacter sp.]|nr:hypothetical protein [Ramlibacter sp.]
MVMNRALPAWEAWHRAELQARATEQELHRAWKKFFLAGGPAPPAELERNAALLRAVASVRLQDARAFA